MEDHNLETKHLN
jgi:hypothetical protein